MCRKKREKSKEEKSTGGSNTGSSSKQSPTGIKQLETEEEKSGDSEGVSSGSKEDDIYQIYLCEVRREDPLFISPQINGKQSEMELDTGAALSVTGNKTFRMKYPGGE